MTSRPTVSATLLSLFLLALTGCKPGGDRKADLPSNQIDYWQYASPTRVKAVDTLIKVFEAANPGLRVVQHNLPFDDFTLKLATSLDAGQDGPDVVQFFYGWLPEYRKRNILVPLPDSAFPPAVLDTAFLPLVNRLKVDGHYYGLPTGVRALSLFWNKALFKEVGLDPNVPPATLDDLVRMATRLTKHDKLGNLTQSGLALQPDNQDHTWWREVLVRQFGGEPYSADGRQVRYNSAAGLAALNFYVDLIKKYHVGEPGFKGGQSPAFKEGYAAMTVFGPFGLQEFVSGKQVSYGTAELPTHAGKKVTAGTYWAAGLTRRPQGVRLANAEKFIAFLSSEQTMQYWLETVHELPARRAASLAAWANSDPRLTPFVKGLQYATATPLTSELAQRKVFIDMVNRIVDDNADPKLVLAEGAAAEQKMLDEFYAAK
jgi:multiple sugar transport system substrate-binding protein